MAMSRKKHSHPALPVFVTGRRARRRDEKGNKLAIPENAHLIGGRIYSLHPTKGWRNRSAHVMGMWMDRQAGVRL